MRRRGPYGGYSLPGGASAQILPSALPKRTGGHGQVRACTLEIRTMRRAGTCYCLKTPEGAEKLGKHRSGQKMRIGTVLIAIAIAAVSVPALGQTNVNSRALADCVQAADQKYKDAWKALCAQDGKVGHCLDFMGSPQDKEFYQLRIEEMTTCSKLYDK